MVGTIIITAHWLRWGSTNKFMQSFSLSYGQENVNNLMKIPIIIRYNIIQSYP